MKEWVDILFKNGLAGLLAFLVFVIERKLRPFAIGPHPKVVFVALYCGFWLATFGIAGLLAYVALNPPEFVLMGTVENLQGAETVSISEEVPYYYNYRDLERGKIPPRFSPEPGVPVDKSKRPFNAVWCIFTPKRIEKVTLVFLRNEADPGRAYEIPIGPNLYSERVRIAYIRKQDKLVLVEGGKQRELTPALAKQADRKPPWWRLPTVHAQETQPAPPVVQIIGKLESQDPLVRREARKALANQGPKALPEIENVLLDNQSPYLLRVGVLSALNFMGLSSKIRKEARAVILEAKEDRDPVIRSLAEDFVENEEKVTKESETPTTTVWKIDKPTVVLPATIYDQIQFQAGDSVSMKAGGCVQTGGSGLTWKRYVDPQGQDSERLYFGLVRLPGMPALVRIAELANTADRTVTTSAEGPLQLGYADDFYLDNGYKGPDNGTGDQCKGLGFAWVRVEITHPQKSMVRQMVQQKH